METLSEGGKISKEFFLVLHHAYKNPLRFLKEIECFNESPRSSVTLGPKESILMVLILVS